MSKSARKDRKIYKTLDEASADMIQGDNCSRIKQRKEKDGSVYYCNGFIIYKKPFNVLNKIKKEKYKYTTCFNEIMIGNQKRKPYFDIETYFDNEEDFLKIRKRFLVNLKKDIIHVFKELYGYDIIKSDILISESSGYAEKTCKKEIIVEKQQDEESSDDENENKENSNNESQDEENKDKNESKTEKKFENITIKCYKMSFHVTISPKNVTYYYCTDTYGVSWAGHLAKEMIKYNSYYYKKIDEQVYSRLPQMRIIGSFSGGRELRPLNDKFQPIKITNDLQTHFITYMRGKEIKLITPIFKQINDKKISNVLRTGKASKTNISSEILQLVRKVHPTAKFKEAKDNYYNFTFTNRNEPCPLTDIIHLGTNGFYVKQNQIGYFMYCHSDSCKDKSRYLGIVEPIDDFMKISTKINTPYLTSNKEVIKKVNNWLIDESKTLVIKSPMGTGKTTLVEYILGKVEEQINCDDYKILWITHRQSLTRQIYGQFKKYGFVSYLDKTDKPLYDSNRIIVQIDSLFKLLYRDFSEEVAKYKTYDMIIIDEIEGNLAHYSCGIIKRKSQALFSILSANISACKKLLLLDADVDMRTFLFAQHFDKYSIINNTYLPRCKTFKLTNDFKSFEENIFEDIKNKKNICIISMSALSIKSIEERLIRKKINYILHTQASNDEYKKYLEDVNTYWLNYQVVLFSSTIECGIDFNKPHFHKIYGIIKSGFYTCSQRSFLQMIGRIRQVKSDEILCHFEGSLFANAPYYTLDNMIEYFKYIDELNNTIIPCDNFEIKDGNLIVTKNELGLFDLINMINEAESLNRKSKIFLSVLYKLINRKGHIIICDFKTKNKQQYTLDASKVLSEINERKYDEKELRIKQKNNNLNKDEKIALSKIEFNKKWHITNTKNKIQFEDFYDKYKFKYDKQRKYAYYFNYYKLNDEHMKDKQEKARHKIVTEFLNILLKSNKEKYKDKDLRNIIIDRTRFNHRIKCIVSKSIYFKNKRARILFPLDKIYFGKFNDKTRIKYLGVIKNILSNYSIKLRSGKTRRIKGKVTSDYVLSIDEEMMKLVRNKYYKKQVIDNFQDLFK